MFFPRLLFYVTPLVLISVFSTDFVSFADAETLVETFVDAQCQHSQQFFTAVDGYPDGACMNIRTSSSSNYESFMLTSLDDQCTITVYGNDTTDLTCSATILQFAEPTTCYNSSWMYLSIDNCANGTASSTSTTSTSSSSKHVPVGGIVGGVVGGIAFIAAIVGGTWYLLLRRRRRRSEAEAREEERKQQDDRVQEGSGSLTWSHQVDDNGVHELQPDSLRHEMEVKNVVLEAPAEPKKVELEASAVPVELEGHFP